MTQAQANLIIKEVELLAIEGSLKEAFIKLLEVVKAGVVVDSEGQPYGISN